MSKLKLFNLTMTFILSCISIYFYLNKEKCKKKKKERKEKCKHPNKQNIIQSILQFWQLKKKLMGGPVNKKSILLLCAVQM